MVGQSTRKGGYLYGPWVRPRNLAANSMGSIHEDETARQYGMRGALVSGRLHLPAFAPLLAEVYGNDWFEHGTLFVEFRYGTLDQEEVRAVLEEPSEAAPMAPVQARLERPDGKLVARGSAGMGPHLRALDLTSYVDGAYELRNLHGPLFLDRPYRVWSEVIGRGQSPKTEYIWYESHVVDEADRCCAELRMQLRFMKRTAGPTLLT